MHKASSQLQLVTLPIFSAIAHHVPAVSPLGARWCRCAFDDIRLGCIRYPRSKYCFTHILENACLTPRPWMSSIDPSDIFNAESGRRQNCLCSHSDGEISRFTATMQPCSSWWRPPQYCMAGRKSYIRRHGVQRASDSQTNR